MKVAIAQRGQLAAAADRRPRPPFAAALLIHALEFDDEVLHALLQSFADRIGE